LGNIHATHKGASQKASQAIKHTAMDNKNCVHFAVICDPVDLDKILEAYDVDDGILTEPDQKFVARYLALLCDLQTTTIAHHVESMHCLSHYVHKLPVATYIKS
jgi:hypothetical protein